MNLLLKEIRHNPLLWLLAFVPGALKRRFSCRAVQTGTSVSCGGLLPVKSDYWQSTFCRRRYALSEKA